MLHAILRNAGIQPRRLLSAVRGWRRYVRERSAYRALGGSDSMPWGNEQPMLTEWEETSGTLGAYFHQDLAVAKWIRAEAPIRHVDVGSRLDGFIGNLACFRNVDVIDIRPSPTDIPGVCFHQLDLMDELPASWVEATDSLSCLHTIEHFGLGRYGDSIDVNGHLKGLAQLKRMVAPGGMFYLSTPIGPERVEFNAHRVFAPNTMLGWFAEGWKIEKFAVIDDADQVIEGDNAKILTDFNGNLGVGILAARKVR